MLHKRNVTLGSRKKIYVLYSTGNRYVATVVLILCNSRCRFIRTNQISCYEWNRAKVRITKNDKCTIVCLKESIFFMNISKQKTVVWWSVHAHDLTGTNSSSSSSRSVKTRKQQLSNVSTRADGMVCFLFLFVVVDFT